MQTRTRAKAIFMVATAGFLISMFYRVSATVVAPDLARDFGLDAGGLGTLSAAFFYTFAAAQIPVGLMLDRIGPRIVMTCLGLVAVAADCLFALAPNAWLAVGGRGLLGIGMASNMMGPFMLVAAWFPPDRFAYLSGMISGTGALGLVLAATPLALLSEALGWRGSFLCIAVLNLVQVACIWILVRDRPESESPQPAGPAPVPVPSAAVPAETSGPSIVLEEPTPRQAPWREVYASRTLWLACLGTFFRYGTIMALQGLWAGPYLMLGLGYDAVTAGNVLLASSLGMIIGLPLAGRISDWLGSRKLVVIPGLAGQALFMAALIVPARMGGLGGVGLLMVIFFAAGLFSGAGQVMYAHVKDLAPRGRAGLTMTSINIFTMLGPAVVLQVAGLLADTEAVAQTGDAAGFDPVWWFFATGLSVAALGYFASRGAGSRRKR